MVRHRKYARYAEGGAVRPEATPVEIDTPKATIVAEKVDDDDSASSAFQAQIDALRRSEQLQREQPAPHLANSHLFEGLTTNQAEFLSVCPKSS
jgi:hypothetical protein